MTKTEKITTTEAIKRALAAGVDQPKEIVAYAKEHFDIDVKPTTVSTTKYHLQKKAAGGTKTQVAAKRTTKKIAAAPTSETVEMLQLFRSVKQLVNQFGAEAVTQAAGVFSE